MADNGRVQVAYLHAHTVSHSWHESMMRLVAYDAAGAGRVVGTSGPFMIRADTGGLVEGRNLAVQRWLDETDHEWLFFVDTDMGFLPDTVERLVQAADPAERPVVGALCFSVREVRYDGYGGRRIMPVPTLFALGKDETGQAGFSVRWQFPDNTLVQVAGTGAACLLVHRGAAEKLRAEHGDHWFDQVRYPDGRTISEDLSFCYRLGAAGIPVFVHTGVRTTHHKQCWIGMDDYSPPTAELAVDNVPDLSVHVDVKASLASLAANAHVRGDGMLKLPVDLDRYRQIIEATKPEVIVETGTRTGASARWFADQGLAVITVDVSHNAFVGGFRGEDDVKMVLGDSADPDVAARVRELVAGRRCMVSLDSDHSGPHVAKEIELYGPLVSPGCYLVVEDGIFGYAPPALRAQHGLGDMVGSPLDAIAEHLAGNPDWSRDIAIERLAPTSHHPAGFWVRNA